MLGFAMVAKASVVLTLCALTLNEAIVVLPHHADGAAAAAPANRSLHLDLHQLRHHFERSQEEHASSMSAIMLNMTPHAALEILRKNDKASPDLIAFAQMATSHKRLRAAHKAGPMTIPAGYSSVDGAKYLLNAMLQESTKKYDMEIMKCRDYYAKQCGVIEAARTTIADANTKGAGCREKMLSAQTQILTQEANMPVGKQALAEHKKRCMGEVQVAKDKIKVLEGDVETMSSLLGMSGCPTALIQTAHHTEKNHVKLLRCRRQCKGASFVSVDHAPFRHHIDKLKSHVAHELLQQSFGDLAGESDWPEFANISMRRTSKPKDPCDDPHHGGPTPSDKRAAKCTISGTASCVTLQEHFGLIQGGLSDEVDGLHGDLGEVTAKCTEAEKTLTTQIVKQEHVLRTHQTKLAEAMSCEAEASEEARLTNKEFIELTDELHKMKHSCSTSYQELESEMCGLRKLRSELYTKMGGSTTIQIFQDCKVSDWSAGECSQECGGGTQKMTRKIDAQPQGGAACPPLVSERSCNEQPCPVDCKLSPWGGWSSCSSDCGGGIRQRLRDIVRPAKHQGTPCGETSETEPCNVQACEADCELGDWSEWQPCSKMCDGGSRKRLKKIAVPSLGSGDCPSIDSPDRLEFKKCNVHPCKKVQATVACKSMIDLILVLDGSGSLGEDGWAAAKQAAKTIIQAMDANLAQVAILLYSGPDSWANIQKCYSSDPVNQETICKIKWVTHLAPNNKGAALAALTGLAWPKGNTLTSLALYNALSETQLGRQDANTIVAVITDGKPMSEKKTLRAAQALRKVSRLMFVPVTSYAPLGELRKMASLPVEENVVVAKDFDTLKNPGFIDHVIADMCPKLD